MHRKLEHDAAGFANAFAHALGEHEVVAVARRKIAAGLCDTDDRLARLQLLQRQDRNSCSAPDTARSCPRWPGSSNQARERSRRGADEFESRCWSISHLKGDGEPQHHRVHVRLARVEAGGWKVRRDWASPEIPAARDTEPVTLPIHTPALADTGRRPGNCRSRTACPGAVVEQLHHAPGGRIFEASRGAQSSRAYRRPRSCGRSRDRGGSARHGLHECARQSRAADGSRTAFPQRFFARRSGSTLRRPVCRHRRRASADGHHTRVRSLASEIEIAVVGDVDDRGLVRCRAVFDRQLVPAR